MARSVEEVAILICLIWTDQDWKKVKLMDQKFILSFTKPCSSCQPWAQEWFFDTLGTRDVTSAFLTVFSHPTWSGIFRNMYIYHSYIASENLLIRFGKGNLPCLHFDLKALAMPSLWAKIIANACHFDPKVLPMPFFSPQMVNFHLL